MLFLSPRYRLHGSAVVRELIDAGHQVLGPPLGCGSQIPCRSAGADVHRGSLEISKAFAAAQRCRWSGPHRFYSTTSQHMDLPPEADRRAVETLGGALTGSNRPLIVTSGTCSLNARARSQQNGCAQSNFPRKGGGGCLALVAQGVRHIGTAASSIPSTATVITAVPTIIGIGARQRCFSVCG